MELLIDADMRKGNLHQPFGLAWENGLSDFLCGKIGLNEAIKTTQVDNLDIMTRGQVPPNPSELLMHPRFKELMEWARSAHVIDAPFNRISG
ncbi:hypothetical protein [Moellerella wisconsensis]|uniref:tyrosine-protein kinase family protein n=1 Tax=Moellerella wisconsensis TaxID=158849 RepID=UPI0030763921